MQFLFGIVLAFFSSPALGADLVSDLISVAGKEKEIWYVTSEFRSEEVKAIFFYAPKTTPPSLTFRASSGKASFSFKLEGKQIERLFQESFTNVHCEGNKNFETAFTFSPDEPLLRIVQIVTQNYEIVETSQLNLTLDKSKKLVESAQFQQELGRGGPVVRGQTFRGFQLEKSTHFLTEIGYYNH